jgi:hypothetical protein
VLTSQPPAGRALAGTSSLVRVPGSARRAALGGRPLSRDDIDVLWTDCVLAAKVRPTEALEVTERLRALGRALGPEDAALWSCRYRSFDEMDESTVVMWVLDDLFGGGP